MLNQVVVSNCFYLHLYLGKTPILTNIFQMGWNHQLVLNVNHLGKISLDIDSLMIFLVAAAFSSTTT